MCDNCFDKVEEYYRVFNKEESQLYDFFDSLILSKIKKKDGFEVFIPAIINKNILNKLGYFDKLPQNITGLSRYDFIDNKHICENVFLTPAACIHIYPMFENQKIENQIITTKARVYRYENKGYAEKTRFWDFTVREVVFLGDPDFIDKNIEFFKNIISSILSILKIDYTWEYASDSFIKTKKNDLIMKIQKANKLKEELNVMIDNKKVAIASINFHDFHFSKTFNFDNNSTVKTACIGLGIERWMELFLEHNVDLNVFSNKMKECNNIHD